MGVLEMRPSAWTRGRLGAVICTRRSSLRGLNQVLYAGHQHGHSLVELIGGLFYHQKYKVFISEHNASSDPTM
jgi:hypothetical protein